MKTPTNQTMGSRWASLLALLAVGVTGVLAACDRTPFLAPPGEPVETEPVVEHAVTGMFVSEAWVRNHARKDHCAEEEEAVRKGWRIPPPWQSYCHNPRPLKAGYVTATAYWAEQVALKREWEGLRRCAMARNDDGGIHQSRVPCTGASACHGNLESEPLSIPWDFT